MEQVDSGFIVIDYMWLMYTKVFEKLGGIHCRGKLGTTNKWKVKQH